MVNTKGTSEILVYPLFRSLHNGLWLNRRLVACTSTDGILKVRMSLLASIVATVTAVTTSTASTSAHEVLGP